MRNARGRTALAAEIRRPLGLPADQRKFIVGYSPVRGGKDELAVNRRSMLQVMGAFDGQTLCALTAAMFFFTLTDTGGAENLPLITIPAQ